jgi:hypothetical protein
MIFGWVEGNVVDVFVYQMNFPVYSFAPDSGLASVREGCRVLQASIGK